MVSGKSSEVVLLLGSNIGHREHWLLKAMEGLKESAGSIKAVSQIYESEPWGFDAEKPFLNQAVKLDTELGPRSLLHTIWTIEHDLGRRRGSEKFSSRNIDVDILTWGDKMFWTKKLQVPHIQLQNRKFALIPLVELCSGAKHPLLNKTYFDLLMECNDTTWVRPAVPSHV